MRKETFPDKQNNGSFLLLDLPCKKYWRGILQAEKKEH